MIEAVEREPPVLGESVLAVLPPSVLELPPVAVLPVLPGGPVVVAGPGRRAQLYASVFSNLQDTLHMTKDARLTVGKKKGCVLYACNELKTFFAWEGQEQTLNCSFEREWQEVTEGNKEVAQI